MAYNFECPACKGRFLHNAIEWNTYHKLAGHGFTKEQGWTSPQAKEAFEKEERERKEK